ncbi:MAG: ATP-binding cassette domain-containing protein [Candidatus Lokiarchaeota archaeon]|nr:ATP-binding cassette domain-containing protein [Candidatus Lokiarchaeota archaeon]MBD3201831.1 ATP-binding cassette domain-containing protein [Candidatus Lokiarchaeota archaeon]
MSIINKKSEYKSNNIAFEVNELKKHFEDVKAVDGISFKVKRGECFGFLGPNGAGKTTTINILACFMKPTDGIAKVAGYDVVKETNEVKKHISYCPQENIFYEELNVYENLMFFGKMYEVDKNLLAQRADDLIKKVGLEDKRKTRSEKLSGGMKRRLNLIIGLVHDPDILFLDEPTAGLDPQSRRLIWDYIFELKERNRTIFLTTHYMDEADILSDRLAIIDHGKIIAQGTPEHLKETIGMGDILIFKIEGQKQKIFNTIEKIKSEDYVLDASYTEEDLTTRITAMDGIGKIGDFIEFFTMENLKIVDVEVQRNSLENVFLSLTGRSLRE